MKHFVVLSALAIVLSGCGDQKAQTRGQLGQNLVTAGNTSVNKTIGEGGTTFRIMAKGEAQAEVARNQIALPNSVEATRLLEKITDSVGASPTPSSSVQPSLAPSPTPSGSPTPTVSASLSVLPSPTPSASSVLSVDDGTSLVVGIPTALVGEQYVWDGVITQLSDKNNQDLGDLKLSDLTPEHVRLKLVKQASGGYHLALMGCDSNCSENSAQKDLQDLPLIGVDTSNKQVIVDLSAIGRDLDLIAQADPDGSQTHLKTVFTKTVAFDYSLSTLVFDIESHMIPSTAKAGDPNVQETVFTTRWFLRLSSAFNPAFESRPPTDGVGFFVTQRSAETKITRWSYTSDDGVAPVHYYVKNVPQQYQASFASAFDEWNTRLKPVLGKEIFSYEFVSESDPRNALLVPGDPRFNIVEWDLVNKASYGGLGPSIANQFTGENLTANVYIQGPTIENLYKDWFKVNKQAQQLREEGQAKAADVLLIESRHEIFDKLDDLAARPKLDLSMHGMKFKIHSQLPELSDPMAQRNDFDPLPGTLNYDQYMYGYFHDMLTHELGHNLGLRHNFKGNLGSTGNGDGEVSRSVMEYLSRDYRYLDHVGGYDVMALSYGYTGKKPDHLDWFCTDEDGVDNDPANNSAECTSNDATSDPFSWYQMRLGQAINYLIARGDNGAPTWTVDDMARELGIAVKGMGFYVSSATKTSATWVKFFTGGDRPKDGSGVKAYVIEKLKAQVCDTSLDLEAMRKTLPQDQAKTAVNVTALRKKVVDLITAQKVITVDELNCANF